MKKKLIAMLLSAAMCLSLAACGQKADTPDTTDPAEPSGDAATYTVGICQLVQHEALDAATQGFIDALNEALPGQVKIEEKNASGDSNSCATIVNGFVSEGVDLIMANATAALQAAASATSDIPVLGTSITGWIICLSSLDGGSGIVQLLSTSVLTGIIAVIGIIFRMFCKNPTLKHVGDIMLGFAVLMYGMSAMSDSVAPLRQSETFIRLLTSFQNPFLGILAGCLITCVLQSASAAVGILQALAVTGAVDFSVALPLIMGIAIGAAVPVLLSAAGATTAGKRTAFVYLLIDTAGVVLIGALFYTANAVWQFDFVHRTMTTVSVALLNTLFRLLTVVLLAPAIGLLEKIVCLLFPARAEEEEDTAEIDRLTEFWSPLRDP